MRYGRFWKNQYESSDLATRNNAVSQMANQTQSDFNTIAEYEK